MSQAGGGSDITSRIRCFLSALICAGTVGFATAAAAADVTVFAAASLKNALDEISTTFEAETGHSVSLSLAGSSLLARQIALGAPADIYLPANAAWMDYLESENRLVSGSRRDLLSNRLVLERQGLAAGIVNMGYREPQFFGAPLLFGTKQQLQTARRHCRNIATVNFHCCGARLAQKCRERTQFSKCIWQFQKVFLRFCGHLPRFSPPLSVTCLYSIAS